MNWEAFGAIGEVIGATAVVVSLIYVSLQVRAGLMGLQTTTRVSVFQSLVDWNSAIMADPRLAWIFQAGCVDFEALEEDERARYLHIMSAYATQPGARQYWESRKAAFDPRFNAVVESLKEGTLPAGHELSRIVEDPV